MNPHSSSPSARTDMAGDHHSSGHVKVEVAVLGSDIVQDIRTDMAGDRQLRPSDRPWRGDRQLRTYGQHGGGLMTSQDIKDRSSSPGLPVRQFRTVDVATLERTVLSDRHLSWLLSQTPEFFSQTTACLAPCTDLQLSEDMNLLKLCQSSLV